METDLINTLGGPSAHLNVKQVLIEQTQDDFLLY